MGKKYDAYAKAAKAEIMAKNRLSDTEGGSTGAAIQQARTDAQQAEANANFLYKEMLQDPEG